LNPPRGSYEAPENFPAETNADTGELPQLATVRDHSAPLATSGGAEPTEVELESAIVRAVTLGLGDVAQTLARRLDERRRGANVIDLGAKRGRRR
jgi:hypothetical protein